MYGEGRLRDRSFFHSIHEQAARQLPPWIPSMLLSTLPQVTTNTTAMPLPTPRPSAWASATNRRPAGWIRTPWTCVPSSMRTTLTIPRPVVPDGVFCTGGLATRLRRRVVVVSILLHPRPHRRFNGFGCHMIAFRMPQGILI